MIFDNNKSPQEHYDFAKKLLPLRREGILILKGYVQLPKSRTPCSKSQLVCFLINIVL